MPSHSSQAVNPPCRPNGPSHGMFGHARQPADDRDVAVVAEAERLVRPAEDPAPDDAGRVRPALDPALGDARRRLPRLPRLHGGIADDEDLGVAGHGQVGLDEDPAVAVRLGAGRLGDPTGERRREHAGRPQDGPGRDDLLGRALAGLSRSTTRTDRSSMSVTRVPVRTVDAEPLELAPGRRGPVGRIGRQDPVHRLDQDDPGVGRVDRPEVAAERVAGDLAERAGQLHARRPAADEHERHPLAPPFRIGFPFRGLERDEDAPPDLQWRPRGS